MQYASFKSLGNGCTVVFGGDQGTRDSFAQDFSSHNPNYCLQVLPCLINTKKGLFSKPKPLLETLLQEVEKSKRPEIQMRLKKESAYLGISNQLVRTPDTLSYVQKLLWSFLFASVCGCRQFLLRDDNQTLSIQRVCELITWLQIYAGVDKYDIVWLTAQHPDCFFDPLFSDDIAEQHGNAFMGKFLENKAVLSNCRHLYHLTGNEIIEEDLCEFSNVLLEKVQRKRAEIVAQACDKYIVAKEMEKNGKVEQALEIYEELIPDKIPEAMLAAGKIYLNYNLPNLSSDQRISRGNDLIYTAAHKYCYAPAYLYLGDQELEHLHCSVLALSDDNKFDCIRRAYEHYAWAAKLQNTAGMYNVAKLCLRYKMSEVWDDGYISFSLSPEDAIPFIQQLDKLSQNDWSAHIYLLHLQMISADICKKALNE